MPGRLSLILDRIAERRTLGRWTAVASQAGKTDMPALKAVRGEARQVRREIDRLLHVAEGRLAQGAGALPRPLHSDWVWRPDLWSGPVVPPGLAPVETRAPVGGGATVFHDCKSSELTARQSRNRRETDLAPYGFRMDVLGFDGSFLSLVIDLPDAAVQGLTLRHLVRLDAVVEMERPIEIFARLNVRHGPNTEQIVRELPRGGGTSMVEFDLAYTRMNEKRVERAWIDLIFEGPAMNQITLRDLILSRRTRAEV
jgi:Family of unknown function (DUF6478)